MRRPTHPRILATALALAAAALIPHPATAQERTGPFIGGGLGVEQITSTGTSTTHVNPSLQARAGWTFDQTVSAVVEFGYHGIGGDVADSTTIDPGFSLGPRTFTTLTLLAGVQLQVTPGWYVRPAVGFASHQFPVTVYDGDVVYQETSSEGGPAAQLTIGHRLTGSRLPIGIEAFGLYSTGEDSTSPRWATGLQLTADLHF
jgi:hypothetical protein